MNESADPPRRCVTARVNQGLEPWVLHQPLANVSDPIASRKEKQKSRRRGERTIDLRKLQALS